MSAQTRTLSFKRQVNIPPAEAYRAFTNPTALRDWLSKAADAQPRKGGRLYLWWSDDVFAAGHFTALEPDKKVAFTWQHSQEPEPSQVQVTFKPKAEGTLISLKQTVGSGRKWAEAAAAAETRWTDGLENLQSILETCIDAAAKRRPRMGIIFSDFNADIAARLGVPVSAGVRLEGTAEGSGAQAAGLQHSDVIVRLAGKKVYDPDSLGPILESHYAGDTVPVVFYRGAEKITAPLKLGNPVLPVIPPTAEALTEAARQGYQEVNTAVAGLIEGVTEAEAEHRPSPTEWTVKELLAHYIACERDLQAWTAELINGGNNAGIAQDSLEFRPNVTPRLAALVARYPTLPELMEEMKHSQAETLALLAALPAELIGRKHLYARVSAWVIETIPDHLDEHREQFAAAIASARAA